MLRAGRWRLLRVSPFVVASHTCTLPDRDHAAPAFRPLMPPSFTPPSTTRSSWANCPTAIAGSHDTHPPRSSIAIPSTHSTGGE